MISAFCSFVKTKLLEEFKDVFNINETQMPLHDPYRSLAVWLNEQVSEIILAQKALAPFLLNPHVLGYLREALKRIFTQLDQLSMVNINISQ